MSEIAGVRIGVSNSLLRYKDTTFLGAHPRNLFSASSNTTNLHPSRPPEPKGHAGSIMGRLDGGIGGEGFQEIHTASAGAMKIRAIGGIGNEFWGKTFATVAHGKGNFVIFGLAFELHFARSAFFAAVTYRIRHTFRKREQYVMPKFRGHAGAVELLARPFVDLLQLV